MRAAIEWLQGLGEFTWGAPTVVLLLAAGAYLSFVLRGVQFRALRQGLRTAFILRDERAADGEISHFQALMVALGGSVGLGNVLGVAAAMAAGGPGALVWLWVAGWLVMATRYAEGVLGVYYREQDGRGRLAGGPMYYLARGVGGWFGRGLAVWFAIFAMLAALTVGTLVPGHAAATALDASLSVPPLLTALVLAGAATAVVTGGIRAIGRVLGVLVPVLLTAGLALALVLIAVNWQMLDDALFRVLDSAFTATAAVGGALGASVREGVRWGVAQGVLSAGTGFGTGGIAAAAARTRTANTQALVAMTQTFIDTVVVSAVAGVALLVTDPGIGLLAPGSAEFTGAAGHPSAFPAALPGDAGQAILAVGLALVAYSTILAWAHYGERSAEYLFGTRVTPVFRGMVALAVLAGGTMIQLGLADGIVLARALGSVVSGGLVIPNVIGLLLLSGVAVRETVRSPDVG